MPRQSTLPSSIVGLVCPRGCIVLKPLLFRRAVAVSIFIVVILQFLVCQLTIVAKFDYYYQQHQEEQHLHSFSLSGVGRKQMGPFYKHSFKAHITDGHNVVKREQHFSQKLRSNFPQSNTSLSNTIGAAVGTNMNFSSLLDKNDTNWPISLFGKEEVATEQCWMSSITGMLGCGWDGHAFSADMHCHQKNDTNAAVSRHHVVIKIRIKPRLPKDEGYGFPWTGGKVYDSKKASLERGAELHKILFNNTSRNMRKHFHIPLGTVMVSPFRLWEVVARENKCGMHNQNILESSETKEAVKLGIPPPPVRVVVMEHAGNQILQPDKIKTTDDQHCIVRDLVCIYDHMHKRNFLHQDILYRHFLYDGEHVSLIDFDMSKFLKPDEKIYEPKNKSEKKKKGKKKGKKKSKKKKSDESNSIISERFEDHDLKEIREKYHILVRKEQLFQLFSIIGSVCTKTVDIFPEEEREKRFDRNTLRDIDFADHPFYQNWTLALKQCNFMNRPLSTSSLFYKNITSAQTYHILTEWTGGCSN